MEHYSQQTSRRKTICITDVLIHGNVCDLSTKADEDPKIKMWMPAPGSQMLASSYSQQGTHCQQVRFSIFRSLYVGSSGESADLRERHRRKDEEMYKQPSIFLYAERSVLPMLVGTWHESGMNWKPISRARLGVAWNK